MFCNFRAPHYGLRALVALVVMSFLSSAAFARKKPAPAPPPPLRASQPPSATIPIAQLGFAPPGDFYIGTRQAMASLDFLDEDHLLFTFRVPGLYHRDPRGEPDETERHIRAVVLHVPDGALQSEALWTVHDRARYLYMLDNGQFALRDRDSIELSDATLQITPWLRFPGAVYWAEFDPSSQFLIANSHEPETAAAKPGMVGSPDTAAVSVTEDGDGSDGTAGLGKKDIVLRILQRSSGQVLFVSHIRRPIRVAMNADGYLEALRSRGTQWLLNLDYFSGGMTRVGVVESVCVPELSFLSHDEFVASTCDTGGGHALVGMTTDGKRLWQVPGSNLEVWPLLYVSRNGVRMAREAVIASHPVSAALPLGSEDFERQQVTVYDAATGKQVFHADPSPVLDAGGNVALSPSGRRAAVLMDGNIQVFELGDGK